MWNIVISLHHRSVQVFNEWLLLTRKKWNDWDIHMKKGTITPLLSRELLLPRYRSMEKIRKMWLQCPKVSNLSCLSARKHLGRSPSSSQFVTLSQLTKSLGDQNGAFQIWYHCEITMSSFQSSTYCAIPTPENCLKGNWS